MLICVRACEYFIFLLHSTHSNTVVGKKKKSTSFVRLQLLIPHLGHYDITNKETYHSGIMTHHTHNILVYYDSTMVAMTVVTQWPIMVSLSQLCHNNKLYITL